VPTDNQVSGRFLLSVADRPPIKPGPSSLGSQYSTFSNQVSILFKTKLALMHASRHFEQNGTRDPSSTSAKTPLDSTAIYPTIPVIFHPLIAL